MNLTAREILSYYGIAEEEFIKHYGMPRRSGRYPWGSGKDPYQHSIDFLGRVEARRKEGFTYTDEQGKTWTGDTAIAKDMGLSTSQFRTEISLAKDTKRMYDVARAKSLRDDGLSNSEIGRKMGVNESTVRSWFNAEAESRMLQARNTADFIKKQVDKYDMVDVGKGANLELGISREKLKEALYLLQREGYELYGGGISQINNPGQQTNQVVICKPGTKHNEIYDYGRVHALNEDKFISRDGGDTFEKKFTYPASMDSKRLKIKYSEDGGLENDGLVEIRRNVPDLSLGESRYAQVRILVDGTHYIKGMAVYSDDLPDGVDVVFNTNKKRGTPMTDVLKKIKEDPDNPFGSLIKDADQGGQYWYDDPKTGEKKLGLINKRSDQGDWTEWKDALPSQFLGKQNYSLIKKQLDLAKTDKYDEYDEICSLNNPTIKKHLLGKFADECDAAAVNLQAAALPGQKYHVIIPCNTLRDNEVFAPQYDNGTKLALIRYPHGGTFEIPILTVNNKNQQARQRIGTDSIDAIGINKKNADMLSGADFDGDTVMCIPTHDSKGRIKITATKPLAGLVGFDPKLEYGADRIETAEDGTVYGYRNGHKFRRMSNTQNQMGVISNLITDMTLAGAPEDKIAAAVRHSMVVIDAEKHCLDYKQSELDNNIAALHKEYQGKTTGGAATLLSRAKGQTSVLKRQGSPHVNMRNSVRYEFNSSRPEGALVYNTADDLYYPVRSYDKNTKTMTLTTSNGKKIKYNVEDKEEADKYSPVQKVDEKTGKVTFTNKDGSIIYKTKTRLQRSTKMMETDDANTLVSTFRHPKELLYADYANSMKALANQARKEMMSTGKIAYSASAKSTYQKEFDSLMEKLNNSLLNATKERAAQRKANAEIEEKRKSFPDLKNGDLSKMGQQALNKYRQQLGSVSRRERNIEITDKEWDAIQAGAISENRLKMILDNTDIDKLRERAMPRSTNALSPTKISRIKAYAASNFTLEEIAKKVGVSTSVVSKCLRGEV